MATMDNIVGAMISLMIILVVAYLGPGLGQEVATILPINASGDFASVTTGAEIWESAIGILSVVIVIVLIAMAIKSLYDLKKGSE